MSSDNYIVSVLARDGATVDIEAVLTGNAGFAGLPHPRGRSVFLMLAWMDGEKGAVHGRLEADARQLGVSVLELLTDPGWIRANIDRYVIEAVITHTREIQGDDEAARFGDWLWEQAYGDDATEDEDELYVRHAPRWQCRVTFADAELAQALVPGRRFGSAAYAAYEEPETPKMHEAPNCELVTIEIDEDGRPLV